MSFSPRLPNAPSQYDRVNEAQFRAQLRQAIQDLSSPSGTSLDLDDLDDVNVPGPSDDDVLMWSTDRWVAFALFTENLTFEGNLTVNGTLTLVGDVTAANVDFSGDVTFTGATTVPEATVTAHQAALAIAFSQLTGSIAAGQVPEAVVTQHQAALAIAASQVTAGTFGSGAFTFTGGLLTLTGQTGELLRLDDSSATGSPRIGLYRDGTLHARFQFNNSGSRLYIVNDAAGIIRLYTQSATHTATFNYSGANILFGSVDERLRLEHASASGSPYLTFYQDGTRRVFIQYSDSLFGLQTVMDEASAVIRFVPKNAAGTALDLLRIDPDGPYIQLNVSQGPEDEILRLNGDATSSPYLTLYQDGTQRAFIKSNNNGYLEIVNSKATSGNIAVATNGNVEFFSQAGFGNKNLTIAEGGDITAHRGDVIATV